MARTAYTETNLKTPAQQRSALWAKVQEYTGQPDLIAFAAKIVDECRIPARDTALLAACIQKWVQKHIKYFSEAPDRWQSPMRTLEWKIGDCDDQAILMASILRGFRVPVRAKFLRWTDPKTRKRKGHVYTQALLNGKWTTLETVRPVKLGWDAEDFLRKKGITAQAEVIGDSHGS